jgi:DeoR/GlpR family transcriptional regulator of sugar metabolism
LLAEDRRSRLLTDLNEHGSVEVVDLVDRLGVSEMTVRRDLATLEQRGLLRRVRGGAILPQGRSYEPPFALRNTTHSEEKAAIAEAAATLVSDGDSVALDVGTTTLALAHRLADRHNLTVLTPSLHVARALADSPTITVVLSGGTVRPSEGSLVGHVAARTFSEFNVDKLFLGIGGLHPDRGLTEFNVDDAIVKRTMIGYATEVTVLADASKLGRVALAHVAPVTAAQRLITDAGSGTAVISDLEGRGLDVTVATTPAVHTATQEGQ